MSLSFRSRYLFPKLLSYIPIIRFSHAQVKDQSRPRHADLSSSVAILVLLCVLLTSILSGVVGMAGGMILIAVLVTVLPVTSAMILHGTVQSIANGSRFWFLRSNMVWTVIPPYLLGTTIVFAGFVFTTIIPRPALVLLLVGTFPWIARLVPRLSGLDIAKPSHAFACGVSVTLAQLLTGASGPLLDVFYLKSSLNRYQIVATKAFTQTLGHLIKLVYYGGMASIAVDALDPLLTPGFIIGSVSLAVAGTWIGTRFLDRVNEAAFRTVTGRIILIVGTLAIVKGAWDLFT